MIIRPRPCLAPLHVLQRAWQPWVTASMPAELAELVDALMVGQQLVLFDPPQPDQDRGVLSTLSRTSDTEPYSEMRRRR